MPDDGLEFAANETVLHTKLNRKTLTVGRGTQINSITTLYPGKQVYSTLSENNFFVNKMYIRNAANSAWTANLVESAEQNSGSLADEVGIRLADLRFYRFYTLPSTEKFYLITKFELLCSNAPGTTGFVCGADVVNANPPTLNSTPLVAISNVVHTSNTGLFSTTIVSSRFIRGGTLLGLWFSQDSTTNAYGFDSGNTNINCRKSSGYNPNPNFSDNTAWTASTEYPNLKVYFRGYS